MTKITLSQLEHHLFAAADILSWIKEYKEDGTVQKIFFKKYTEFAAGFSP